MSATPIRAAVTRVNPKAKKSKPKKTNPPRELAGSSSAPTEPPLDGGEMPLDAPRGEPADDSHAASSLDSASPSIGHRVFGLGQDKPALDDIVGSDLRQVYDDAIDHNERIGRLIAPTLTVEAGLIAAAGFLQSLPQRADWLLVTGVVGLALAGSLIALSFRRVASSSYYTGNDSQKRAAVEFEFDRAKGLAHLLGCAIVILTLSAVLIFGNVLGSVEADRQAHPTDSTATQ